MTFARSRESGSLGAEGLGRVLAELDREERAAREHDLAPLYEVHDWRKLFRTRVFMSARHFRAVAGFGGRLDYWILIDMRFQWIAQGSMLWHTSFTVWSDLPWSVHHRSPQAMVRDPRGLSADDASHLIEDYESSRRAFRDIIKAPDRSALRVFGRHYQPPSFLVAVPALPPGPVLPAPSHPHPSSPPRLRPSWPPTSRPPPSRRPRKRTPASCRTWPA